MQQAIATDTALLLDLIPKEVLEAQLEAHKDNPKVAEAITNHLTAQANAQIYKQALDDISTLLNALVLPDITVIPSDVYNFYIPIVNETIPLSKKEVDEVLASNPTLTREDVSTRIKETGRRIYGAWVLNKAMTSAKGATSATSGKTRKLSISLYKRNIDCADEFIGNFRNATEALEKHLGTDRKGDSAVRVLDAKGYSTQAYDGESFLLPE